jgi:hypothetical protein
VERGCGLPLAGDRSEPIRVHDGDLDDAVVAAVEEPVFSKSMMAKPAADESDWIIRLAPLIRASCK